jgi:hypothetical protein
MVWTLGTQMQSVDFGEANHTNLIYFFVGSIL